MSKYRVFPVPYFPVFELDSEINKLDSVFGPNTGKYGPEKTPYLDTFHTVMAVAKDTCFNATSTQEFYVVYKKKPYKNLK